MTATKTAGHQITFVTLAAVALIACGSSPDDASDGSDRSTNASTVTTAGTGSSQPTGTTADTTTPTTEEPSGSGDEGIDSVQWGPDDPPIPDQYRAFAADSAGGLACDSIDGPAEDDEFWALARDICLVFTGAGDWPEAATVPMAPQDGNAYQRCLDWELSHVLDRALAWHAEHPGATPSVRYPSSGTHSGCQTTLYDVGVTDTDVDPDGDCADESLDLPTPGIPVSVSAPGILGFANPQASVDGAALCVIEDQQDSALRRFVVVVPTSGEAQTVTITVETNYGTLSATVPLPAIVVEPTDSAPTDSEPTVSEPTDSDTTATDTNGNGDDTPTGSTTESDNGQGTPDGP